MIVGQMLLKVSLYKYYIYIQRLFNQNKLDVYAYMTLLKNTVTTERQISINNNNLDKFEKISTII